MTSPNRIQTVAVLGLGNELLCDDGVGIHALRHLAQSPPEGVLLAEVGTAVLRAQSILESVEHVIAIDAIHHKGDPGSIYCFQPDLADRPCFYGLHDLDLPALVSLIPAQKRPTLTIIGVEPKTIDYGLELTPTVRAVLGELTRQVRDLLQRIDKVRTDRNVVRSLRAVS